MATLEPPPPWFAICDEPSVILRLHEELIDFSGFMRPSGDELAARRSWAAAVEGVAKSLWASCEVHLFGSSVTGLCLPNADVDIAVNSVDTSISATDALKQLAEKLLEADLVSRIELFESAKAPLIKLQQKSTGLVASVTINISQTVLDSSSFISEQVTRQPALTHLALFLRVFLAQRALDEPCKGGMGSYLLVCVILSFLQRHPSSHSEKAHTKTTLGHLIFDLLRHYAQEFKYGFHGISVQSQEKLFNRESRGWTGQDANGRPLLCVESPTEPSVDLGQQCTRFGVIRAALNHGYHVLGELLVSGQGPGESILCPNLLRAEHPLIGHRHQSLQEAGEAVDAAKRRRLAEAANEGVGEEDAEGEDVLLFTEDVPVVDVFTNGTDFIAF